MQTQVLIIGAGATGTGIFRDLALRGVECMLIEQRDVNAGASGGNHGLLHSGARYVSTDPHSANECKVEGDIIKEFAPHCIENTGGLFVAVKGDDEEYVKQFPINCQNAGVPCKEISPEEALRLEPNLNPDVIAAYEVEDASIDPFKLSLENVADAEAHGGVYKRYIKLLGFNKEGGKVTGARVVNTRTGEEFVIEAEQFVNATGAWASNVAAMAGAKIRMTYAAGTLLITQSRINHRVINRLRPPGDGDILVPGGTVSVLGTTSVRVEDLDHVAPTIAEVNRNIEQGAQMVPALDTCRYVRAYAGVRPLVQLGDASSDRAASRGFALLNHEDEDLDNFITITGGKLTTYRLMAERCADLVCNRIKVDTACKTRGTVLPDFVQTEWAEPSILTKREWMRRHNSDDYLLCECEIVPKSAVDAILDSFGPDEKPRLQAVGLRSRVGKGSCQGAFCGARIAAHMYDRDLFEGDAGLDSMRDFLSKRWKGQRPILWDAQFNQAELKEALYFGLLNLEMD